VTRRGPDAPADLDELITAALERAAKGQSAQQVHKALPRAGRPTRELVAERLRQMAHGGIVHPWPGGKVPLFGVRRYEDHLRDHIATVARDDPRTEAQLRKGVPPPAHPLLHQLLDEMIRSGRLFRHPKLGRREIFGSTSPDPRPYLAPLLSDAIRKTVKKGFREEEVRAALRRLVRESGDADQPTTEDPGQIIRRTILELNPRAKDGALVYIPHVRVAVGTRLDKDAFDRMLLALLSQERVQLQAHPVPAQLTADEKQAMVPDGRGSYYMAVGLR
jgi:hypothetical protein